MSMTSTSTARVRRVCAVLLLALVLLATASLSAVPLAEGAARLTRCSASVSTHHPKQGSTVTVKARALDAAGRPIKGARVVFAWSFKSGRVSVVRATNSTGYAYSSRNIGSAPTSYKVFVKATAESGGAAKSASAWFVPSSAAGSTAQNVYIGIGPSGYVPTTVYVDAGRPIELTLGQGSSCAAYFRIPSLDVSLDSSKGPASVSLPALKAGSYLFRCSMGMYTGHIVAR